MRVSMIGPGHAGTTASGVRTGFMSLARRDVGRANEAGE
jgi:hypothetical protein